MSTLGTLTSLLVGKNDADLTPISLNDAGVLTWTHGVGTKQGFGGRAVAVRVWSWDPAGGATVGQNLAVNAGLPGGMQVAQPDVAGIVDTLVITNATGGVITFLVEVLWEYPSAELDLTIGNRAQAAPGVSDTPYASPGQAAGTFGRFVFSNI